MASCSVNSTFVFNTYIYIYTVYINGLNILLVLWMYYHYYVCMHYSRMYYLIVLYHGIWYNDILLFPINFDVGMIFCIGMLRSDYQKRQVDRLANPFQSFRGQLMSTDVNWCQLNTALLSQLCIDFLCRVRPSAAKSNSRHRQVRDPFHHEGTGISQRLEFVAWST